MRFGLFNKFGALNSQPVFAAFQQGLDQLGFSHSSHNMSADVAVIWSVLWSGRMRQNQAVWQHFRKLGRPVVVLEVGMLQRGQTWKMGINGTGSKAFYGHGLDLQRPQKLNLQLKPWRDSGDDIVVALQRDDSEQWAGQPAIETWLKQTVENLREHTQRPIVIRSHPRREVVVLPGCAIDKPLHMSNTYDDFDFDRALGNAWAVVNWNSGPGSQSVMSGVPAFVGATSLAAPVANLDWSQIETPVRPDRSEWLINLAHTEWTCAELATGLPIARLFPDKSKFDHTGF
jgi:hypothetical protein